MSGIKFLLLKYFWSVSVFFENLSQQAYQPPHSNLELVDETENIDTSSSIVPTVSHVQDGSNSGNDFSLSEDDSFLSDSGDDEDDNDMFSCLQ